MGSASDQWYERHGGAPDRPSVSVWYPSSPPHARLQTIAGHGDQPDRLPDGPLIAYLLMEPWTGSLPPLSEDAADA